MTRQDFETRILSSIVRHSMLEPGERVLAAVSGGADSMALLQVLYRLGYRVEVVHLDHGTRQGESAVDAAFVRDAAAKLGLPFHLETRPIAREADKLDISFEMHARNARYAFFMNVARERQCAAVATGHHRGDQAETVMLRLLRGAGPTGLSGIPPVRHEKGLRVIRPLLMVSRQEIIAWLESIGVAWREDRSNQSREFLRNRVRHELLPRLQAASNPALESALARLADSLRVENNLVETLSEAAACKLLSGDGLHLERAGFDACHEAIQRRVMLAWGWKNSLAMDFGQVQKAVQFIRCAPVGHRLSIDGKNELYNGRTHTDWLRQHPGNKADAPVPLRVPGETIALGRRFVCRYVEAPLEETLKARARPWRQFFDAGLFMEDAWVRTRRPGDRFQPLGMVGTKDIQKYYKEVGLPAPDRAAHPLIEAGGHIVWVVEHAISGLTAVTHNTARLLQIEVEDIKP